MKSTLIAWIALLAIAYSSAQACEIEQARKFKLGASSGIKGKCSNNGQDIKCIFDKYDPSWSCEGPEGHYDNLGEDLAQALIAQACGCSSRLQ